MRLALLILCTAAACTADAGFQPDGGVATEDGASATAWAPLVQPGLWRATPGDADPLAAHRDEARLCPEFAWYEELGGVEIATTGCAYASLEQPLARAVAAGDRLRVVAWWQTLVSLEPAQGHIAVLIDGEILWQEQVAIPGPADAREVELSAPADFPVGATVVLHVHNHGYNTWNLNELSILE